MNTYKSLNKLVDGQLVFSVLNSVEGSKGIFITGCEETIALEKEDWPCYVKNPGDPCWLITSINNDGTPCFKILSFRDRYISSIRECMENHCSIILGVIIHVSSAREVIKVSFGPSSYLNVECPSEIRESLRFGKLVQISINYNGSLKVVSVSPFLPYNAGQSSFLKKITTDYGILYKYDQIKFFPKELNDSSFSNIDKIVSKIVAKTSLLEEDALNQLCLGYTEAVKNNEVICESSQKKLFSFQTSINQDCEIGKLPLEIVFKRSHSLSGPEFFLTFVGPRSRNIDKFVRNEIFIASWHKFCKKLFRISGRGTWWSNWHVLISNFCFTYYIAVTLKKLKFGEFYHKKCAIFDTGFYDDFFRPVYCVLRVVDDELKDKAPKFHGYKYIFDDFVVLSSGKKNSFEKFVSSIVDSSFAKVNYLEYFDFANLFSDPSIEINLDYPHILIDNLEKFPQKFFENNTDNNSEFMQLYETVNNGNYAKVKEALSKDEELLSRLSNVLQASKKLMMKRCGSNHRDVLPIFYPADGRVSFILPLSLEPFAEEESQCVDVALVVSKQPSGDLEGTTILTLDDAYKDSRLVRTDNSWHKQPRKTNEEDL